MTGLGLTRSYLVLAHFTDKLCRVSSPHLVVGDRPPGSKDTAGSEDAALPHGGSLRGQKGETGPRGEGIQQAWTAVRFSGEGKGGGGGGGCQPYLHQDALVLDYALVVDLAGAEGTAGSDGHVRADECGRAASGRARAAKRGGRECRRGKQLEGELRVLFRTTRTTSWTSAVPGKKPLRAHAA